MESLSRPPHRRKHSSSTNASSSSFSLKNPYDDVTLSRSGKAKFEPREYAEIFSGSSSIPVLDLSGLTQPRGCRSSDLDYSNIFGGARDDDVAVPYDQLFNGVKKTKTRMPAEAEQENGLLSSSGKAKRSLATNGVSADGMKQQLNMSYNKTSQRSSNESNGKTHIAQLHAVPGFTHFVDGAPQLQKKEGDRSVLPVKHEVSRTWSFQGSIDATKVNAGLSSEKSHALDKPSDANGVKLKSRISKVQPHSDRPAGSNDSNDIKRSSLPSFASKETSGENSPPLFDEELDENSDAAVSIAALKKAIEQAQESIRLAKMVMQKRREGIKDGSRARRSKGRSEVEDKKENKTERPSGCVKENNVMEKNQQLDPNFPMFCGVNGKSTPTLSHNDKFVNARHSKETVRENFDAANDLRDAFIKVEKKFAPSCSRSESLNTDNKVEVGNIGQNILDSKPLGERANIGTLETVVVVSGKVECNNNLIGSRTKVVPCLEHMETNQESLEQRAPTTHQPDEPAVISGGSESAANTSQSVLELEQSLNEEALEQCQETASPTKRLAGLAEQLERVQSVPLSTQEQERITHGGGDLRISQENDQKFVGNEEFYVAEDSRMPRSDFSNLHNESLSLADKNRVNQADTDNQPENLFEWKEYAQDGKCNDEDENLMVPKEEILWFESELQLEEHVEEQITEREPEILPGVGEAATKVDTVLEPEIDDEKLNVELENDSQNVPGEHGESKSASICEAIESTQMGTNNDLEVEDNGISSGVEELNDADREACRTKNFEDNVEELKDSVSEKDSSEAFAVHSNNPPGTIFREKYGINTRTILSETPEPCNVNFNEAEKYQSVLRGCEDNFGLPQETEIFMAVEDNVAGKQFDPELNKMPETDSLRRCASSEKFTESQLNNTFEGLSLDSKSPNVVFVDSDHEKILPDNEDFIRGTTENHNTAVEYAAKTNMQNCPEIHAKPNLQQNSENGEESQSSSTLESIDEVSAHECPVSIDDAKDISSEKEEVKGDRDDERVHAGNSEDQSHLSQSNGKLEEMEKTVEAERDMRTGQNMENSMKNFSKTSTSEQQNAKGNEQKYEVDDHLQRIEAIKRGREREKDRIAVDKVIREARERAFVEARERAERAAAERAAAETRQRGTGEVREKTVKSTVETKPSADKASIEAKLRAQRAAVERATTEARERALEKAMSQKTSMGMGARVQGAKYSAERSSSSSINSGLKHSFSSSDMDKSDGAISESEQRRKARLERHQRIMERAAKALAEKNMRDFLAQKEQAERSRLAESLDADIKRWATGKQGNLRALLSTLQYILGPDSGWQPLSLTEIVTTAAVKKAYRKATLCVHPDKLQQRGANIQQKYICEKIFDLLKAAWNRFNSEEN